MAEESLARRIATSVLTALKSDGHILVERGGMDAVVRELTTLLAVPLPRLVARAARAPVSGEVTSTFGDEATDEAVEELVAELREAIVESEHVEDVFAEDRELDRSIFLLMRDLLIEASATEEDEAADTVPISVRLDTLGYVAATAAQRAEESVVRQALERAAKLADGELSQFEPTSRIALFAMSGEDADRRLEVEEAVADELVSLVTEGAVELPTIERRIPLTRSLNPLEWRAARPLVDAVAKRLLDATGVPSSWRPDGASAIRLSFTPLSEKDADLVGEIATAFQRDVDALVGGGAAEHPPSSRGTTRRVVEEPAPKSSKPVSSRRPVEAAPASKRAAAEAAPPSKRAAAEPAPASKRPAKAASPPPASKRAGTPATSDEKPASKRAKAPPKRGG